MENNFEELSMEEIEQVDGGSFFSAVGFAVGYALGGGGAMMRHIDGSGVMLMSAMQYGA